MTKVYDFETHLLRKRFINWIDSQIAKGIRPHPHSMEIYYGYKKLDK